MKPASYQSMASVMNPNISLGHLLSTPNVMQCDKCRFATTDISAFKKHVAREHTEYYCFYCNRVSLSEAELQTHLQIHTGTSPFKCPHCGQVYMRRMCLIKHIDRIHNNIIPQEPPKLAPRIPVSSASQSVSSIADAASQRPVVRVNVPAPSTAGVTLDTNLQRLKSLSTYISNASHGNAVPSNGHIQRNRALTVSLPEEVSIPAGCMVEVAEVKTVDGTKELRLRFVSHQEKESVTKNGRTTVPETSKLLSSQTIYPNTESGIQFVNKNHKTKMVNKDRPTLVPANISKSFPNQTMKEQRLSTKRPPEVINLDPCVPNKIPRNFISAGEANVASQKEPINHAMTPSSMSPMLANRLTSGTLLAENRPTLISLNGAEERKRCPQGPPSTSETIIMSNVQIIPHIVPINRGSTTVKVKEANPIQQKNKLEVTNIQQKNLKTQLLSLKPSMASPPQGRVTNECKDNFVPKIFIQEQGSSQKVSAEPLPAKKDPNTTKTNLQLPALPQEVKTESSTEDVRVEREGFPVIYSVYSLSQQPSEPQESTQPIVMAEWTNSAGCDSPKIKRVHTEQSKMTTGNQAHEDSKDVNTTETLSQKVCESVKIEKNQVSALESPTSICLKKEKNTTAKVNNKCKMPSKVNESRSPSSHANIDKTCLPQESAEVGKTCPPLLLQLNKANSPPKSPKGKKTRAQPKPAKEKKTKAPSIQPAVQPAVHTDQIISPPPLVTEKTSLKPTEAKTVSENPSKFLTVSLKRVEVSLSKNKKKFKTVSKLSFGRRKCAALQLMPLRRDQAVKLPSPDQPVVVLNRPTPCVHMETIPLKTLAVSPKCQILKMKLGKVVGRKYEVMGCTTRNCS